VQGFSEQQKGALKEVTWKLIRADSRLADRAKALDARIADRITKKSELISSSLKVEGALADFREELRVLGKEMYALPDPGEEQPIFTMPASTNSVTIGNQTIAVRTSATISRAPAANLDNLVHLQMSSNLGDLQQSITPILQSHLAHSDACGERVAIQQAMSGSASDLLRGGTHKPERPDAFGNGISTAWISSRKTTYGSSGTSISIASSAVPSG